MGNGRIKPLATDEVVTGWLASSLDAFGLLGAEDGVITTSFFTFSQFFCAKRTVANKGNYEGNDDKGSYRPDSIDDQTD